MTEVLQHPDNFTVDELRQRVEKDYEMQLQLKKQEASKRQDTGGFYTKQRSQTPRGQEDYHSQRSNSRQAVEVEVKKSS